MRPRFLLAMAWRESRAAHRRMTLLVAAVAIGVAALVAINSFTRNLLTAIDRQGQALLGADIRFSARAPFTPRLEALIDTIANETLATLCQRGECGLAVSDVVAQRTDFDAMAYVPRTEGTRFARVNAVEGPYPFYGNITTSPAGRWEQLAGGRRAIVDPALLTSLAATVGDTLVLGEGHFEIIAAIEDIPGAAGVQSAFTPRVFISAKWLETTKLITFGSRVSYRTYMRLADEAAAEPIADEYGPVLRPDRIRIRTAKRAREDMLEDLDQLRAARRCRLIVVIFDLQFVGFPLDHDAAHLINARDGKLVAVLRMDAIGRVFAGKRNRRAEDDGVALDLGGGRRHRQRDAHGQCRSGGQSPGVE